MINNHTNNLISYATGRNIGSIFYPDATGKRLTTAKNAAPVVMTLQTTNGMISSPEEVLSAMCW